MMTALALAGLALGHTVGLCQTPPSDQADVIRVYTDLAQTDVMVFDKAGRFVNGLKRDDFELKIAAKTKSIELFDCVTAGSAREESQLTAARGPRSLANQPNSISQASLERGRTIFFYIDDQHLDLGSLSAARKLIADFIESGMSPRDEAAVMSASGQIGFLQQLTDDKTVLRAAVGRLVPRSYSVSDLLRPPMTEYQSLLVDQQDLDVTSYFIRETIRQNPGIGLDAAAKIVGDRARTLLQQAQHVTAKTLSALEGMIRSANKIPGRKLVFLISGGFFLDYRNSDSLERTRRITSAAARSGVVIYSMDARGLVANLTASSADVPFDPSGRLARAAQDELLASQDLMNALARDTGGQLIHNTNDLRPGLNRAIDETSAYYLLAWKPEIGNGGQREFRHIEVKVVGRPDLTVRVRRGFYDVEPTSGSSRTSERKNQKSESPANTQLREALGEPFPNRGIPVSVILNYVGMPDKGVMLSTSMQIPFEFVSFNSSDGGEHAVVDILGAIFNDKGAEEAHFRHRLNIAGPSVETDQNAGAKISYTHAVVLGPGLYQVRVAARDERSGRVGSAQAWVEIPDLSVPRLTLSSLMVGAREQTLLGAFPSKPGTHDQARLNVDHRFPLNSHLRLLLFVYNAMRSQANAAPEVAVQVQITRDEQPVLTNTLQRVSTEGIQDLARLPYAADISLEGLRPGRYQLRVNVVDRLAKTSASLQRQFGIE